MKLKQQPKPGSRGVKIRLADGHTWLFPRPVFRAGFPALTSPNIDRHIDAIFDLNIQGQWIEWSDLFAAGRALLKVNYDLADDDVSSLLTFRHKKEAGAFARSILDLIFDEAEPDRTYTLWVRATLLANGLGGLDISSEDLPNVLEILEATKRTVPLTEFANSCIDAAERRKVEGFRKGATKR